MFTRSLAVLGAALLVITPAQSTELKRPPESALTQTLTQLKPLLGVPALSAAVVTDDGIEVAAVGVRRLGSASRVTTADRFHTGSDSKAMLATVAARLVEAGRVRWDVSIGEVFPELGAHTYKNVTLEQLLRHRGGFLALYEVETIAQVPAFPGSPRQQRTAFVRWVVQTNPVATPGTRAEYSNAGYAVAAAMLERLTGHSYEWIMQEWLFRPLRMNVSYDWPAAGETFRQPWGHEWLDGRFVARSPYWPTALIPMWLRPALGVSLTTRDFARFVRLHLNGLRFGSQLLSRAGFERLHTPVDGYGMGWYVAEIDGRSISMHTGESGLFTATMWLDPHVGRAAVVMTNAGGELAQAGLEQIGAALLEGVIP